MPKKKISRFKPTTQSTRVHPLPRRYIKDIQKSISKGVIGLLNATHRDLRSHQRLHPNCVEGWLVLGDLESFANEDKALECFLNALLWDPVNPEAHLEVAKWLADRVKSTSLLRFHAETALRNCRYTGDDWMWLEAIINLADEHKGLADLARKAEQFLRIGFPHEYQLLVSSRKKRKKGVRSRSG